MTEIRLALLSLCMLQVTLQTGCAIQSVSPASSPGPDPQAFPPKPVPQSFPSEPAAPMLQIKKQPTPLDQIAVLHALLNHLQQWQGTRHRLGGTSRRGIDCSAYTQRVFSELFNITLPRSSADQSRTGRKISASQLRVGDLVFFSQRRRKIDHVGIYLGDNTFMHVGSKKGVSRSRLDRGYWKPFFRGARRFLECPNC